MSLFRRSILRCRPSVANIIINSHQNPIGRITDEFDREIKQFFSNTHSVSDLVSHLLSDPTNLKIPTKIRKIICLSIMKQLPDLSLPEFLSVPRFIRKLPSLSPATTEEDDLFQSWLSELIPNRFNSFTFDQIESLILSIKQLRITTQCTDEPIVRLFQHISRNRETISNQGINDILVIVAKNFDNQSMNQIRQDLVSLVLSTNSVENNIHAIVQLPIFPDCQSHIQNLLPSTPAITPQFLVAYLIAPIKLTLPNKPNVDFQSVCLELAKLGLSTTLEPNKAQEILTHKSDWKKFSLPQLAGFMRLKSACMDKSDVENILTHVIRSSQSDPRSAFPIFGSALILTPESPSLEQFIETISTPLNRRDILSLFPVTIPVQLVSVCEKVLIPNLNDAIAAATFITRLDSTSLSEKLYSLFETSSIDQLIAVEKILSNNGLVYLKGSASEPLKRTTRTLFRKIRMAPVK